MDKIRRNVRRSDEVAAPCLLNRAPKRRQNPMTMERSELSRHPTAQNVWGLGLASPCVPLALARCQPSGRHCPAATVALPMFVQRVPSTDIGLAFGHFIGPRKAGVFPAVEVAASVLVHVALETIDHGIDLGEARLLQQVCGAGGTIAGAANQDDGI